MGVTEKQLKRYSARVRRQRRLRWLTLAALALLAVFLLVDRNFRPLVFSLAEARSAAMATRALNAALTEALEDGVDYDDLMNVRMDDGGQVSLLSANTMRMNTLAERAGDAALRKLETVSAQKVDVPLGAALGLTLLALVLNVLSAMGTVTMGNVLFAVLIVVSSPMVCSGYWALSLFLWACLLIVSHSLLRKNFN